MNIDQKLSALDRIYTLYHDLTATFETACTKGCATCCTSKVTLTSLEGYRIVGQLIQNNQLNLLRRLDGIDPARRFCPQLTTNALADTCARGQDPPEEPERPQGACPLLDKSVCPIYSVRPFGCRCLVSRHRCRSQGYADIDEYVLTVNTVCLQVLEHLDAEGVTGSLVDILRLFESADTRRDYRNGRLRISSEILVPNSPLRVLMIPPEHRDRIKPFLQLLSEV